MRKLRHTEESRDRSVILFDSLTELLDHNLEKDHRSKRMDKHPPEWYGAKNMQEADRIARAGLAREGVEALKLSHDRVAHIAGELHKHEFDEFMDTSGAFVDMGRYLEGTPECMTNFMPVETPGQSNIVALILNITYNWTITPAAIKKNGQAMMALCEAIETAGMQAEVWLDMNVRKGHTHEGTKRAYARTAVKLKKAGQAFDVAAFMYALTHNSFLRCHIFNAMHEHPGDIRKAVGIGSGGYGHVINNAADMDDFPPYSIYIPVITESRQAGQFVPRVLKQLNLIAA